MLKQIEEEEKAQIVRLGDASIASPFTSKLSTTQCGRSICLSVNLILLLLSVSFNRLILLDITLA